MKITHEKHGFWAFWLFDARFLGSTNTSTMRYSTDVKKSFGQLDVNSSTDVFRDSLGAQKNSGRVLAGRTSLGYNSPKEVWYQLYCCAKCKLSQTNVGSAPRVLQTEYSLRVHCGCGRKKRTLWLH